MEPVLVDHPIPHVAVVTLNVRAVSWSEITTVTRSRFGTTRSGYELHLAGGRKLVVEAVESTDTGREIGRQIEEAAAHAGMQVIG